MGAENGESSRVITWTRVLTVFTVLLVAKTAAELWLDALNRRQVQANAGVVPAGLKEIIDGPTYQKSVDYTLTKNSFGQWQTLYDAGWLFAWLGLGWAPLVYGAVAGALGRTLWAQAAVLFVMMIVLALPGIPWDWWGQFRLEERFGFNRTTTKVWVTDKLKGLALGVALGYPLLLALLGFFRWQPRWWWLWAWAALLLFQLVMMVLAPKVILPLFNKLTPLPEGPLRERLMELAQRTGFQCSTIEVIDGSKRSGHSNAFFTGFGRFRRIVLYDTLIAQMTPPELEAVLAHEIGHYRCGHVPKMLAVSALLSLAGFGLLGWLAGQAWFAAGFGFDPALGMPATLLLFMMVADLGTFWLTPLGNLWSRKHEYEADAFARAAMHDAGPMVQALRKLHEKNLSNLTPHPVYSFFYYSHPTLVEREAALRAPAPA
jgi:STE24 endopeptidase